MLASFRLKVMYTLKNQYDAQAGIPSTHVCTVTPWNPWNPLWPYSHGAHTAPNLNIVCWSQVWVTTSDKRKKKRKKKKKIMGWHSMPVLLPYCALLAALVLLSAPNPARGRIKGVALSADDRLVTSSTLQLNKGGTLDNSSQLQQSSKSPDAKPQKSHNMKSNKKKKTENGQGAKGSGAQAPEPFTGRLVATSGHHAASFSLYLGAAVQALAHATTSMHPDHVVCCPHTEQVIRTIQATIASRVNQSAMQYNARTISQPCCKLLSKIC